MPIPGAMSGSGAMSSPPIPPPDSPTLSAMMPGQSPGANQGGALPKLFFEVDKTLDVIASAAPGVSGQIDEIKAKLHDVMTSIANGGASGMARPSTPSSGMAPY